MREVEIVLFLAASCAVLWGFVHTKNTPELSRVVQRLIFVVKIQAESAGL